MLTRRLVLVVLLAVLLGVAVPAPTGARPHPEGTPRVPPSPSAGCGSSTVEAGQTGEALVSGGVERTYIRHVPAAHDGDTPLPLVVAFHGFIEGAALHLVTSEYVPLAESEGFVVVYPQGLGNPAAWNPAPGSADVAMVGDLLDRLEADLCLDTHRIFVSGYSMGAFLSSTLACVYPDRIAALAPVAGLRNPAGCAPERAAPILTFHGTVDTFVPFGPIPGVVGAWADRNGCDPSPTEELVAADDVVDIVLVSHVCEGAPVDLYRIDGGGHGWPGSPFSKQVEAVVGYTTMEIRATDLIWEFFEQHPMPPPRCRDLAPTPSGHTPSRGCGPANPRGGR